MEALGFDTLPPMKHSLLLFPLVALLFACQAPTPAKPSASYAFGLSIGANLAKTHVTLDC